MYVQTCVIVIAGTFSRSCDCFVIVSVKMNSIIDTHFHIWDLNLRLKYPKTDGSFDWPDESLSKIYRNILADEAASEFKTSKVEAAIFVQCLNGSPEEIKWVEDLSSTYPVIKGLVGGIDLSQVNQSFYSCTLLTHNDIDIIFTIFSRDSDLRNSSVSP